MWERIFEILKKEIRQSLRDPRLRGAMFIPPIMQMLIFGYAVSLDVNNVNLGWLDLDRTEQSRGLLRKFQGSQYFTLTATATSEQEAQGLLDRGKVDAVVRVPSNFGADVSRMKQTEVQVLVDGSNSNTASIIGNYATGVISNYNTETLQSQRNARLVESTRNGPVRIAVPSVSPQTRVWFNADLKSRNYFVPGILVNIIMIVTLNMTAMSIVREKEIGTMEQIMVTPIRPIELMIGKTLPFALVGFIDSVFVTIIALLLFHVPLRGSVLLLIGAALLFLMSMLGMGLFISTISHTQQQASMTSFFFLQPAFMLSGFTFPIRNMPEVVQWITYINPLRYFMDIVRGVFLKGAGIEALWSQMVMLALFGVAILSTSALRFRKRLD
jgi:ABC-2 type transport system permease protein